MGETMGTGITIECTKCHFTETYQLGVGMAYYSLEAVMGLVSPARRQTVKKLLKRKDLRNVDYGHRLFECPKCHILTERFDYRIEYGVNKIFIPSFRCGHCRRVLISAKKPLKDHACPQCGARPIKVFENSVLWD
jgi:predicted nucleic-acid-binding Zn-ribbon protein